MRIMKSAVVLGLVAMASVSTLNAQVPGRASFHLGGGVVLPMGTFGDGFGTGWQGMGGVSFGLAGVPFTLRVDATYGQHSADVGGGKVKLFGGLAGAQFNFGVGPSPLKPYIIANIGMYNVSFDAPGFTGETKLAFGGGAGLQFGLGSLNAFVEGKLISVQTSGSNLNMLPVVVGIRFGGM